LALGHLVHLWLACLALRSRLSPQAASQTGQRVCLVASRHLLLVRGHQVLAVLLVVLPAHQVRVRGLAQQGQQACLQDREASSSSSSRARLLVWPLGDISRLALQDRSSATPV
jgi:hypothetical protein